MVTHSGNPIKDAVEGCARRHGVTQRNAARCDNYNY
jgi:hypothetical protein